MIKTLGCGQDGFVLHMSLIRLCWVGLGCGIESNVLLRGCVVVGGVVSIRDDVFCYRLCWLSFFGVRWNSCCG